MTITQTRPYIKNMMPWSYHLSPGSTSWSVIHHASSQFLLYQNKNPFPDYHFLNKIEHAPLHLAFGLPFLHQHSPFIIFSIHFIILALRLTSGAPTLSKNTFLTSSVSDHFLFFWGTHLRVLYNPNPFFILLESVQIFFRRTSPTYPPIFLPWQ